MSTSLLFLLCFLAIALGWLLGRVSLRTWWHRFRNRGWQQPYLQVMHLLLHEQSDQAIEGFIHNWPVTPHNIELHHALANMLRKKGEADRAIHIRAGIVQCKKLSQAQVQEATIELAHDYLAAGLLDRAERLLINVANDTKYVDERVLSLLQRLYQTEQEWHKAIAVAKQLLPKHSIRFADANTLNGKQSREIAHYYCEIAVLALAEERYLDAEQSLQQALATDENCARANMLLAQMWQAKHDKEKSLQCLAQIERQDCRLLSECIELLRQACDDEQMFYQWLLRWQENFPSASFEQAIYAQLVHLQQPEQAKQFFLHAVERRPTLKGLRQLAQFDFSETERDYIKRQLSVLYQLTDSMIKAKPQYQCVNCGFAGMQLHWLCPQCKQFDSIRRRRGSEGD